MPVACGTTFAVRRALRGRPLRPDDLEGAARGAVAYTETISGSDYVEALSRIHACRRELGAFFTEYDILLTAALAELPAKIGRFAHATEDCVGYRPCRKMVFGYSPFTAAFNASGQPAASVPLAWSRSGLPIGIHLAARFGHDEMLMALCAELEGARPCLARRPPLVARHDWSKSRELDRL